MFDDMQQPDTSLEETLETPEQEVQPEPEAPAEEDRPQAIRFRNLREKVNQLERERDEAIRLAKELQMRQSSPATHHEEQFNDEDWSIAENELAEGRHLQKIKKELKAVKDELKKSQRQSLQASEEMRLKHEFPDIYKVVTKENLEILREMYPTVAQTLDADPNLYSKGATAHTLIKQLGIYREDTYQAEKERVHKNAAKPKPVSAVAPQQGNNALSRANIFANGLTDELKEMLAREVEEAIMRG